MIPTTSYGLHKLVDLPYEDAVTQITEALKLEGFGVLTEIDVQTTMKKKLDLDMARYVILGACNPTLAHQALEAEYTAGLLLPCNVIVYEDEATGKTGVSILNPATLTQLSQSEGVHAVAEEANELLERVLANV
jgi:uncharacterized protein (DUF302 family)